MPKKMILASQLSNARSRNNERQLQRELSRFFAKLGDKVLEQLREIYNDNLLVGQAELITKPITDATTEYYHILQKYDKREYKLGQAEAQRLLSESDLLQRAQREFQKIKEQVMAECDALKRQAVEESSNTNAVKAAIIDLSFIFITPLD